MLLIFTVLSWLSIFLVLLLLAYCFKVWTE
jgi:hypothetical protein